MREETVGGCETGRSAEGAAGRASSWAPTRKSSWRTGSRKREKRVRGGIASS